MATKLHPLKASFAALIIGLAASVAAVPESSNTSTVTVLEKGIGVLPFVSLGDETPQWLAAGVESYLRHNLRDLKSTRVPLEEEIVSGLKHSGISLSEKIAADKLKKIGQKLSVDALVLGAVQLKGNKVVLKIKAISTHRTKILKELEQKGTLDNLNLMLQETTALLAEACRVQIAPEDKIWIAAPGDFKYTDFKEIEEARLFAHKEDYANAIKVCEELMQERPRLAMPILTAAEIFVKMNQPDRSEKVLNEGISKMPGSVALHLKLGGIYLEQGRVDEAKRKIDTLLVRHPEEPHALLILAESYMQKGLRELALNTLEKGLVASAQKEKYYLMMSQIHKEKGNLPLALNLCESALKEDAGNIEALKKKGILLGLTGDYEGAASSYRKSLSDASALSPQASAAANPSAKSAAEPSILLEFREAVKRDPADASAHNALGAALAQQGKWIEAIESYRSAVRINPQFAPAFFNLGAIYAEQGKSEEAINCFRKSLELNPRHRESALKLASIYETAGEHAASIKILEKIFAQYPADSTLAGKVADHYARDGKWKKVIQVCESVQTTTGTPGQASLMIAQAYERQGKTKKAKSFYERSFKENPKLSAKKQ